MKNWNFDFEWRQSDLWSDGLGQFPFTLNLIFYSEFIITKRENHVLPHVTHLVSSSKCIINSIIWSQDVSDVNCEFKVRSLKLMSTSPNIEIAI